MTVRIRGARQNNLQGVDLDLPLDRLVVFTGRSGSGKSSLAFDTIHAEGQRRYLEALSMRLRATAGGLQRPDVDVISGVPPTIALRQRGAEGSGRSTVGSFTELDIALRVLFGRVGVQHSPTTGEVIRTSTHDEIVARLLALPLGTRLFVEAPIRAVDGATLDEIERSGFSRVRVGGEVVRIGEVDRDAVGDGPVRVVVDRVKVAPDRADRLYDAVRTASLAGQGRIVAVAGEQTLVFADRPWDEATGTVLPQVSPALFRAPGPDPCVACEGGGRVGEQSCTTCGGSGLGAAARAVRWEGVSLPELRAMTVGALVAVAPGWSRNPITEPLLEEVSRRLGSLHEVGLDHLRLDTPVSRVSSGEHQRLRLARQVSAELSGVLFVLDEPTTGLDSGRVAGLIGLVRKLLAQGNGVLVVEHRRQVIEAADHVVEFGPGPGGDGGRIVFAGPVSELLAGDTVTGRWLSGRSALEPQSATARGSFEVPLAGHRNLQAGSVSFGLGALTAVSGVSGAGKTAVLEALIAHAASLVDERGGVFRRMIAVDAGSVRKSPRSTPATYSGLWSRMRELLAATREAQVRGLGASTFSLNVKGGRCEACRGLGVRKVDLQFLPEVHVTCDVCAGRRFSGDVLEVRWKGLNAGELLDLRIDDAHRVLAGHPRLEETLRALRATGIGYLQLGQPAHTLSGGEAQRLKLARELAKVTRRGGEDVLFVLDEPVSGLHPADVDVLYRLLRSLVAEGSTVVLATHDQALVAACDHELRVETGVVRAC